MRENLLITFGCSWTYGVGVGYTDGMSSSDYMNIAWDKDLCDNWSYRGMLCNSLNFDNLNFSQGGYSNQAQFHLAKKYFGSDDFLQSKKTYKKIVVLHAITSTARNYFFDLETQTVRHVKYDYPNKFSKFMLKHSYDHDFEIEQLRIEMNLWNMFYKSVEIKNLWIDTFNHHNYSSNIDNLLDSTLSQRDLMSKLCAVNNITFEGRSYHKSSWEIDDDRVLGLVNCNILNPISKHPTKKGHEQIASILQPVLQSLL